MIRPEKTAEEMRRIGIEQLVQATPVCTLCLLLSQRFEAPNLFRL